MYRRGAPSADRHAGKPVSPGPAAALRGRRDALWVPAAAAWGGVRLFVSCDRAIASASRSVLSPSAGIHPVTEQERNELRAAVKLCVRWGVIREGSRQDRRTGAQSALARFFGVSRQDLWMLVDAEGRRRPQDARQRPERRRDAPIIDQGVRGGV